MSRVSIVIPCFGDGAFLGEAVASALAQDHDDVEVVVADDGSTDEATLASLDHAEHRGARVLRLPHAGVSATRNAAIQAATGQYVLPLDADDLLSPTYAGQASAVLDAEPQVGIVGADTEIFGSHTGTRRPVLPQPVDWLVANQLPVSCAFRREDWLSCGGFAEDLAWGEDWHFWVRIVALGREVSLLPMIGLHYRRRQGQATFAPAWDVQERSRARVLQAGLPIINRYPEDATRLIAGQLNHLQAVRQRRSERLRSAAIRVLGR